MYHTRLCTICSRRFVRRYSTTNLENSQYEKTRSNLKIGSHTKVIFQGFTGKQATFDAQQSIDYGTNIVGGTNPKRDGEHLGRPLFKTVREAQEKLKADASVIYVPASGAAAAMAEAIEAEVPLICSVAEFIPLHDMLRIHAMLKTQTKSRLLGANCPGMINPHGKCRLGFPPIPFYKPGEVGIIAKSGTLSYEAVAATTEAAVGQSLVVGIGGDPLPGTDFVDVLTILEHDANTKAIVIIGEIGGLAEYQAASWITDYRQRTPNPKPIAGLIAGFRAKPQRVMGHAGASFHEAAETAEAKYEALQRAGVAMVHHPSHFGRLMVDLLKNSTASTISSTSLSTVQKRAHHTAVRRPIVQPYRNVQQRQAYTVSSDTRKDLLREFGLESGLDSPQNAISVCVRIYADRNAYMSAFSITHSVRSKHGVYIDVHYHCSEDTMVQDVRTAVKKLQVPFASSNELAQQVYKLFTLWKDKEMDNLTATLEWDGSKSLWQVSETEFHFDDTAVRTSKRHEELWGKRVEARTEVEVEALQYGIVYMQIPGDGNIGTIVNGAGLAMNTTDCLTRLRGKPSNFLDTGGKATAETISQSFRTVLSDPNVTAIFVNIFGGLTLGDMIAKGVILAYKEVGIKIPVVCRIRGTNEKEGQKLIAESGLPIEPFQDFNKAARRVIELANAGTTEREKSKLTRPELDT